MVVAILTSVTILVLLIASYTDLKKREVPDWLNYGLIFAALGIRLIFSFDQGWQVFANGLLGLIFTLAIALLFYYTNQWGGGDSKLLMGMGAVIGLGYDFKSISNFDFSLFLFFIGLLLFGAIFGLFWSAALAIKNRIKFLKEFKKIITEFRTWHLLAAVATIIFITLGLFHFIFWPLIIFPLASFYILTFIQAVEKQCFIKEVSVNKLTEGDWLAKSVTIENKKVADRGKGLQKEQIRELKNLANLGKIKKVWVKEGIPFVPSFLLSYLVLIFGKKIVSLLF